MASNIVAHKQLGILNDTEGVYRVPYRVIEEDKALTLLPLDARDAAIAQGTSDIGIAPASAPVREVSKNEAFVDLTFDLVQYYDYTTFIGANPGGTYTPVALPSSTATCYPPQPEYLDEAFEIIQKDPSGMSDSLVLRTDPVTREPAPWLRTPPQQNFSTAFNVPQSLLTASFFFNLSKAAHHLNSDSIVLNGTTFTAGTAMLLSFRLSSQGNGYGTVDMGFAVGEAYTLTWSKDGVPTDMTGFLPFSEPTYAYKTTAATDTTPAIKTYIGLFEHRVWPEYAYQSAGFPAPA